MEYISPYITQASVFFNKQVEGPNKKGVIAGLSVTACLSLYFIISALSRTTSPVEIDAWSLAVTLRFKTDADKTEFKKNLQPYALYVQKNEPLTLSYILSESDKDSKQMHIMERYVNKDAYLNVHKKSPEFVTFRKQLFDMQGQGRLTIEGHSYQEVGIGFNRP